MFRATWWRRYDELGLVCLFLGLLGATVYAAITTPMPKAFPMWMFSILWLFMSAGAVSIFLVAVKEIQVDEDKITLKAFIRSVSVTRDELSEVQVTVAGRASSAIEFKNLKGNTYPVFLKSFDNPQDVIDAVQAWWHDHPATHDGKRIQEFRARSLGGLMIGLSIFLAIFFIGGTIFRPEALPMMAIAGPLVIFLMALGIGSLFSYVRVSPEGIIVKRFGTPKRAAWDEIDSVRLACMSTQHSSSQRETITVKSRGQALVLGGFDNLPTLRDLVLSHVPASKVTDDRPRP